MKNNVCFLILIILNLYTSCKNKTDVTKKEIVQAIKENNYEQFEDWINNGLNLEVIFRGDTVSPLILSIQEECASIAHKIIRQGVNLEFTYKESTPLHWTIKKNQNETAILLINKGVNLNPVNRDGFTPLHLAAMNSSIDIVKELVNHACNINKTDPFGNTALNFAIATGNDRLINFLLSNGAVVYKNNLPNLLEGPHISETKDELIVKYLKHSADYGYSGIIEMAFPKVSGPIQMWFVDSSYYHIRKNSKVFSEYNGVGKIFVLGEIRGHYDRMIEILKRNYVIDERNNWTFGNGHLVFLGDIMYGADKITECLWFIYNLEKKAEKKGGKVHLILGNYEFMILNNDLRYLAKKYKKLYGNLGISYGDHFKGNFVLSKWLRSRNTVLKINDILFVHAGISSELADLQFSLNDINNYTRNYLKAGSNAQNENINKLLTGTKGPVWYNGYFKKSSKYPMIRYDEIVKILMQYQLSTIIVGHTEVDTIDTCFNGVVIGVNVPLWNKEIPNQSLLIDKGNYYRLEKDKQRILIK